jgi:phenylalanyl-tRNA synthetase beta chain
VLEVVKHPNGPPERLPGRRRHRRDAEHRLRRAQRRARHQGAVALVGAELPPGEDGKPFEIKVASCAASRARHAVLGARTEAVRRHSGLLDPAGRRAGRPGHPRHLNLDDTIFTIKLTPNKADCLSVLGVAREVGGADRRAADAADIRRCRQQRRKLPVKISAPDLCGRSRAAIRGVNARAPRRTG